MKDIRIELFALLSLLMTVNLHSQEKQFLDYIITKSSDTIYGTIREKGSRSSLVQRNTNFEQDTVSFYSHSLKNIKEYRYNDNIVRTKSDDDPIYSPIEQVNGKSVTLSKRQSDYIVSGTDTIYGRITLPFASLKRVLTTAEKKRIKIQFPAVSTYCEDNYTFDFKIREKLLPNHKDGDYLLRLYSGRGINLYGYYDFEMSLKVYYMEKDNKVTLFKMSRIYEFFGDDPELLALISEGVYAYDNTYLMVKFYSR